MRRRAMEHQAWVEEEEGLGQRWSTMCTVGKRSTFWQGSGYSPSSSASLGILWIEVRFFRSRSTGFLLTSDNNKESRYFFFQQCFILWRSDIMIIDHKIRVSNLLPNGITWLVDWLNRCSLIIFEDGWVAMVYVVRIIELHLRDHNLDGLMC